MNIAVASYSFHGLRSAGMMDVFGYLETIKHRYGLSRADIWNGMFPSYEEPFLLQVKDALDERGLTVANLCIDQAHIWDDDPEVRAQNAEKAKGALNAAVLLEADTIRIDAGGREDVWTDEQFDLIASTYRQWAQFGFDHGFRVGPENHWGTENIPANMVKLCEAVDHPGFGVLLHFKDLEGDATFAKWAMHTHVPYEWALSADFEPSMRMLADTGYQGCWSAEHHSGQNEYSQVAVQLARINEWLERNRLAE